jgi:hypothetical protein
MVMNYLIFASMNELSHSMRKSLIITSFTSTSRSNKHKTMSHKDSIVELNDLISKSRDRLEVELSCAFLHLF